MGFSPPPSSRCWLFVLRWVLKRGRDLSQQPVVPSAPVLSSAQTGSWSILCPLVCLTGRFVLLSDQCLALQKFFCICLRVTFGQLLRHVPLVFPVVFAGKHHALPVPTSQLFKWRVWSGLVTFFLPPSSFVPARLSCCSVIARRGGHRRLAVFLPQLCGD